MELAIIKEQLILKHRRKSLDFGNYRQVNRSDDSKSKKYTTEEFQSKLSDVLFIEINRYWKTLPAESQDKMFTIFTEVIEDIEHARTPPERQRAITEAVISIVNDYHPYNDIYDFMQTQEIVPTDKVKEEFDESIDMLTRGTTYIYEDYYNLACMTVVIRAVMPIWNKVKSSYNAPQGKAKNVYYEMEMLNTLAATHLSDTEPYVRLHSFVDAMWIKATTGKEKAKSKKGILSSVVAGLGTSDIPNYLYATAVINKLANREINTFRDSGDLVTHVYRRLKSEIGKLHNKFSNIKAKVEQGGGEEEDKIGYLESFRTREKVRRDVHIAATFYLYDYRRAKKRLDDTIPVSLVKACIDSFTQFKPEPIRSDQLVIVQWVLAKIVLPRAIPQIDRKAMINAMAITQAALIHWRFRSLAKLMSAAPVYQENESVLIATPFDTPPLELRNRLSDIYPYYRYSRETTSRRALCPGFQATEEFAKMFADQIWDLKCTPVLCSELQSKLGEFKPSRLIKSEMAELLIIINRRRD